VTATLGAERVVDLLDAVRSSVPLVQCLTNAVVSGVTANALLALGATPAMTDIPDEAGPFAAVASAVLINTGTPRAEQRVAMTEAAAAAQAAATPWVLDPVAVGTLPVRTALARDLLRFSPTAIRGNASEILGLTGAGVGGRGVDAVDAPEAALDAAATLASELGTIVAISGATDHVTDGARVIRVSNGHPLLTAMTGGGCVLGAVIAAFLAVGDDALSATVAATVVYTIAAELAAVTARGPGSFAVELLDCLATVTDRDVRERLRLA
jgi:Hydroxyethylthiazole kinase, sugar kinase family